MTKRFGFTLAEVLITLGIIGVVAAMTIPTLIANTNGAKFRSQFKKTISTLNQAGLMGLAQYDFDYAGATAVCGTPNTAAEGQTSNADTTGSKDAATKELSFCGLLNDTLTGRTNLGFLGASNANGYKDYKAISQTMKGEYTGVAGLTLSNYIAYSMADGSVVAFHKDAKECALAPGNVINSTWLAANSKCVGFIDVNGVTLPNKEVTCETTGNTTNDPSQVCTVPNNAAHMTDIFPVVFHDATVEPATNAAKYVLTTSK